MPDPKPEFPSASSARATIISVCKRLFDFIPPKARIAVLAGSLVLVYLLIYASLSGGSATLNVNCRLGFHRADIEVLVDGKPAYTDHISANHISTNPKKLFGLFDKRGEVLSKSLVLPAGDHIVQVHLSTAVYKFDETTQRQVKLEPASESTLTVTAESGLMSVVYKHPVAAEAENGYYSALIRSMLVMVFGSAVSATIGFVVTESQSFCVPRRQFNFWEEPPLYRDSRFGVFCLNSSSAMSQNANGEPAWLPVSVFRSPRAKLQASLAVAHRKSGVETAVSVYSGARAIAS